MLPRSWRERRDSPAVLCASGMAAEARVARTAGFSAIVGAGNAISTAILIGNTGRHTKCLISFGVAGGLAPYLRPGDVILSTEVIGNDRRWLAEAMFRCAVATLAEQLGLFEGPTLGSHGIIASKEEKRHAWRENWSTSRRSRERYSCQRGGSRPNPVSRTASDRRPRNTGVATCRVTCV
jgi:hypothetical protein